MRAAVAISVCLVLGVGAFLAEQAFGPLGRVMETNLLLLGVALLAPLLLLPRKR